jgi:hypothetical protein
VVPIVIFQRYVFAPGVPILLAYVFPTSNLGTVGLELLFHAIAIAAYFSLILLALGVPLRSAVGFENSKLKSFAIASMLLFTSVYTLGFEAGRQAIAARSALANAKQPRTSLLKCKVQRDGVLLRSYTNGVLLIRH